MLSSAAALLTAFWIILHEQVNRVFRDLLKPTLCEKLNDMLTILVREGFLSPGPIRGLGKHSSRLRSCGV